MSGNVVNDLPDVINTTCLQLLNLDCNTLQSSAVVIFYKLQKISSIKALNLNNNNMSEKVVDDLANVIKFNTNLEELFRLQ